MTRTWRITLALFAALALALTASACGSDDSSSDSASSEGGATIKHKFGTTKVPKDPKRIVTLGYNDHEFLLAMGVEPIAIRDWVGVGPVTKVPWAKDEIAAMIAAACGHLGPSAEYLLRTAQACAELGIRDRHLMRLQALVAERLSACG